MPYAFLLICTDALNAVREGWHRGLQLFKVILAESSTFQSRPRGVVDFSKLSSRSRWLFKVVFAESLAFQSRFRGVVGFSKSFSWSRYIAT